MQQQGALVLLLDFSWGLFGKWGDLLLYDLSPLYLKYSEHSQKNQNKKNNTF